MPPQRAFDLAISLEVAEHLPETSADVFVESLTAAAPIIVFSAAIPMQAAPTMSTNSGPAIGRRSSRPGDSRRSAASASMCGTSWAWNGGTHRTPFCTPRMVRCRGARGLRELAQTRVGEPRAMVHPGCFLAKATQPIGLRRMIREFPASAAACCETNAEVERGSHERPGRFHSDSTLQPWCHARSHARFAVAGATANWRRGRGG